VWESGCRIAAKRLTLTGDADRVGGRLPGDVGSDGGTCRIAAKRLTLTGGVSPVASGCRIAARLRPRRLRRDASPLGHRDATSGRERDTGERGPPVGTQRMGGDAHLVATPRRWTNDACGHRPVDGGVKCYATNHRQV